MPVNVKKCGVNKFFRSIIDTSYHLFGSKLNLSKSERDLGVIVHKVLSYEEHIFAICNKATRMYGWLTRTLVTKDTLVMIRVFKALIRPILEYASTVWSPTHVGLILKLESIQRKVTKFAFRNNPVLEYSDRLRLSKLPTLVWRRLFLDLLMVHRILHGEATLRKELFKLSSEISSTNLRRHCFTIYKDSFSCNIYKHHFAIRVVDEWNALPHDLLNVVNFTIFKKQLKMYLLSNKYPNQWNY